MRRARGGRGRGDRAARRLPDADATRLDLSGASIVRADAVDVPAEAARGERPGGAAWEPTFLISARVSLDDDGGLGGAGERVARTFERVVTTLRLLQARRRRPRPARLGPRRRRPLAADRDRRRASPRPGGYRLTEGDLLRRHRPLAHGRRAPAPGRAPAPRAAALRGRPRPPRRRSTRSTTTCSRCASCSRARARPASACRCASPPSPRAPSDRDRRQAVVEQAIALERELWSGEPRAADGRPGPSEIAGQVEELLRTILRRGVTGELGSDFRAAADEALLADGLAFGEGSPTELRHRHRVGPRGDRDRGDRRAEETGRERRRARLGFDATTRRSCVSGSEAAIAEPSRRELGRDRTGDTPIGVEPADAGAPAARTRRRRLPPIRPRTSPIAEADGRRSADRPITFVDEGLSGGADQTEPSVDRDRCRLARRGRRRRDDGLPGPLEPPRRSRASADGPRGGQGPGRSTSSRGPRRTGPSAAAPAPRRRLSRR